MAEKEIVIKDGTLTSPPMRVKVESGTREDGTEYEVHQNYAPPTFLSQVTDSDGKNAETRMNDMQTQINSATTEIAQTVNDVVTQRTKEDVALKSEIINENLLKNSNFKLNSNNQTVYSVGASQDIVTCDKWRIVTGSNTTLASVTVLEDGIRYAVENGGFFSNFCQWLDNDKKLAGKTITVSFEISDVSGTGSGYFIQIRNSDTYVTIGGGLVVSAGITSATVTVPQNALDVIVGFNCNGDGASGSVTIRWVKVEEGTISTDYVVPDAEIEKVRCGQAIMTHGSNQLTPYPIMNGINVAHEAFYDEAYNIVYGSLTFFRSDGTIKRFQISDRANDIFVYDYDGTNWTNAGVISPNCLPLTGGQISGTIRIRHIDGLTTQFPDDETLQGLYLNYAFPKSHVYIYSGGTNGEALHRGNSKAVSISSTAPVDTECLWIDTINMKTKIYKDGAWTIVG